MKKTFTLLLILFTLVSTAHAQQEDYGGPSSMQRNHNLFSGAGAHNSGFGIKGGVNFSQLRGSDKDMLGSISGHTSFHAGVFAQFAFSDAFSIQPEVLYSRRGYERNDSTFRFDYLNVPILAVFNVTENISLHAGPQIGILMSGKRGGSEIDLAPYNTFDYGAAAGIEAKISWLRLGARYFLGLTDLRKENALGQKINEDIKNGVFQVYLGIGI
ncbi:PorT family protein [Pontibacter qinzhouensis]|uniref:PorT family protein n=1 Tax=Pontibacter qinzhouensis TaxID=2603253 RepID=A0A5C8K7P7_9BACT|nr:porin family protein [Pontibacter qinzhouensis]TXK47425.1 PorT family protein [Pontibacter qinzhouensis]